MDGRRPGTAEESATDIPAARSGSLPRRRLLAVAVAVVAVGAPDPATARRRSKRRRRGRGRGRGCHGGLRQWFAELADRAPEGDGGEVTTDASGGSVVYGDIGPNADVHLSASGGQRVADASGGDGHIDIPPDFEATGQDCVDRRRERRRRRRQRRRR